MDRFKSFKRYKLRKDLIISLKASQRDININWSSHRICYRARTGIQFGEVQFFTELGYCGRWTYIKPFLNLSIDRPKRIASYSGLGASKWITVGQILSIIGVVVDAGVQLIVTDVDLFKPETTRPN